MRRNRLSIVTILSLTLTLAIQAGCGGELVDQDMDPDEAQLDGERGKQANFPGTTFWHKAAYVLTDDTDVGYKAFTDALLPRLGQQKYLTKRINTANAITAIRNDFNSKSMILDTVLLVVNGHGGGVDYTNKGIFTGVNDWTQHHAGIGSSGSFQAVTTRQLVDLMQEIRNKGKRVVILDNSCQGGATVKYVEQRFPQDDKVCALASTGTVTPSGVGYPAYQDVIASPSYPDYLSLGLWASRRLTDSAHGTGGMPRTDRVHQYGYMNGCSMTMRLREGLATAVGGLTTWSAHNRRRHNHVFLNPERYLDRTPVNYNDPNYAPAPNAAAAIDGFTKLSLRDIDNLSKANVELLYTAAPAAAISAKIGIYNIVQNDVNPALKSWQNAYLWSNFVAENTKLCGMSLGQRIAALAKHPTCVKPWLSPVYSQADRDRLTKYYQLSCNNLNGLVPQVLKDYPLLNTAIKNTRTAEQTARDKVLGASLYLYLQLEGKVCDARGCDAIRIY